MNIVDQYARTLVKASQEKSTEEFNIFFEQFIALLKQKNHYKSLGAILRKVEQLSQGSESRNKTVMVVRDALSAGDYADVVAQHADVFGTQYDIEVDEHVVGGFVLKNRTHRIDNSYRSKLVKLYQRLVA